LLSGALFRSMPSANTQQIAFIGFGEVGQTFAEGLLKNDAVRVVAYDILLGGSNDSRIKAKASALGVVLLQSASDAAVGCDIVISAVTASQVETVAKSAAAFLRPGQLFLDVNSAAPSTKQRAAAYVEAAGAHYIECAVMAPVLKPGLGVQILAGGPQATQTANRMNALGMNITAVSVEFGRASAMKLCRSIVIKGLEALIVDCSEASERWDVKEPVFASLASTFPSIDWHKLSNDMRERVSTHGVRRSAEMYEAGEMLSALEMTPDLANAIAEAQLRGARKKEAK
jgi:3-hydroxyisobutyrate dehydrogenase-like beta-hydroxyacid dehydrogenase